MKKENLKIPTLFGKVKVKDIPDEMMKSVVNQIEKNRKGLYLYSRENGTGKTHISYAIAKYLFEKGWNVEFCKVGSLLESLRISLRKKDFGESNALLNKITKVKGLLILDDIGGNEKISEWVLDKLYSIVDYRYEEILPTIFTSNCNYDELALKVGGRISSRIVGMTELFELGGLDKRLKEIKLTI